MVRLTGLKMRMGLARLELTVRPEWAAGLAGLKG